MKFRGILKQSAISLIISNFVYAYTFLCNILLMRMLLPADFGSVALAVSLVGIIEIFTTFSFNTVLIQQRDHPALVRSIFQVATAAIVLKLALGAIFLLVFFSQYGAAIWQLFALLMASKICAGIGPLLAARLQKRGEFLRATMVSSGANMIAVTAAVVAVYAGAGIYGLVLRETLPAVLISAAMVVLHRELMPRGMRVFHRRQLRVVAVTSMRLYFQLGAEMAFSRVPLLLIESFFGTASLGLFSQATYLVTLVQRSTNIVNQSIAPVFFNRNRRDARESRRGFTWLLAANVLLALPAMAVFMFFPREVVLLFWGANWLGAIPYLQLMATMTALLPLFSLYKSRLLGVRRNGTITIIYLIGLVVLASGLWIVHNVPAPAGWVAGLTAGAYALMVALCAGALWLGGRKTAAREARRLRHADITT